MKNNLQNKNSQEKKIDWIHIKKEMRIKFGNDIFESWIKKIELVDEFHNYILFSVSTRFIRDWIVSRYLDQILQIIKEYKKDLVRIEFIIKNTNDFEVGEAHTLNQKPKETNKDNRIYQGFLLQYNRMDPNKNFDNFITGGSNKLAFEASKKVSNDIAHYNPLYLYGGVGMGKTHLLNAIGLELKENHKVMFISAERFMYQFVKSIKSNEMVSLKTIFEIQIFY